MGFVRCEGSLCCTSLIRITLVNGNCLPNFLFHNGPLKEKGRISVSCSRQCCFSSEFWKTAKRKLKCICFYLKKKKKVFLTDMNPVGYIVYFQERKLTAAYVFWIRTTSVSTVHITVSSLKNKRCSYLRKNKFNLETNYPVLKVERLCSPSNVFSDFEDWVKNSVFNQILLCWVCMYPVGSELFKKETDNIGQNNYFFVRKKAIWKH